MTEGKDLRRCFGSGIPREVDAAVVREGGGPRVEAQERRPKGGGDLAARALARAAAAAPRLAVTAESVAEHAGSIVRTGFWREPQDRTGSSHK